MTPNIKENTDILTQLLSKITNNDISLREERLSTATEGFVLALLLNFFFANGSLAPPSLMQPCSDEEYLGAAIGMTQELVRYAIGRACECDAVSIGLCSQLVSQLHESLLEFDFRNGSLRKKYDGLKYAKRRLEALTYELSLLQGPSLGPGSGSEQGHVAKRARIDTSSGGVSVEGGSESAVVSIVPTEELEAMRQRLQEYDARREDVIKRSRDVQKLSKQAVFAVHRGSNTEAAAKIAAAKAIARDLMDIVALEPTLRAGSFSNSLEEWAEASLLLAWVTDRRIESLLDLEPVNTVEYLGALSDFTGEIGRLAVIRATSRDMLYVRQVLETDVAVSAALLSVHGQVGGQFFRKVEAVTTNLKKVEELVYELTLSLRGGRVANDRGTDEDTGAAPVHPE